MLDGPAGLSVVGNEDTVQETLGGPDGGLDQDEDASHRVGSGRVAAGDLPELPTPLGWPM